MRESIFEHHSNYDCMNLTILVLFGKPSDLKEIEIKSGKIVPSEKAKSLRITFDSMTDQIYVKVYIL